MQNFDIHPDGYPTLGLAPRTFDLPAVGDITPGQLARRLEDWEFARGNPYFAAHRLSRVFPDLGHELVAVYTSLRERFPQARPDIVNFCSDLGPDTIAAVYTYRDALPTTRSVALDLDIADPHELLSTYPSVPRRERNYIADGVADVTATGALHVADFLSTKHKLAETLEFMRDLDVKRARRGFAPRTPRATSMPAFTMVHEYGHLIDAELAQRGYDVMAHVYAVLSECVFGEYPSESQWRYHLVNYPEAQGSLPGRLAGSKARRKETQRALKLYLGHTIGRYAGYNRDELFAESFASSLAGPPKARRLLAPFRKAVREALLEPQVI